MPATVVYFTDSGTVGGAEEILLTVMAGLDRSRWRPKLVYADTPGIAPLVRRVEVSGIPHRAVPQVRGKRDLAGLAELVLTFRRSRPAVFHANLHSPISCRYALLAATLARVGAIVATQHYGAIPSDPKPLRDRIAHVGVDRYIAVSEDLAERLRRSLGCAADRVCTIHNAVPLERFPTRPPGAARLELGAPDGRPIVLTVGRLVSAKGFRHLIDAAALVPEPHFVFVGDGPERGALEAHAATRGVADRTRFLGQRDDVPQLLAACDLFVLPSLFEGHPLSVLEAMAAGKPVVATDAGGTREAVLHGETGLLVPPGDPDALARGMRALLDAPDRAARFGRAGRARVEREFSAARMVRRVTGVYEEVLDARAGGVRGAPLEMPPVDSQPDRVDGRLLDSIARRVRSHPGQVHGGRP